MFFMFFTNEFRVSKMLKWRPILTYNEVLEVPYIIVNIAILHYFRESRTLQI